MCGPGQLFFSCCGPEMPKAWTPLSAHLVKAKLGERKAGLPANCDGKVNKQHLLWVKGRTRAFLWETLLRVFPDFPPHRSILVLTPHSVPVALPTESEQKTHPGPGAESVRAESRAPPLPAPSRQYAYGMCTE